MNVSESESEEESEGKGSVLGSFCDVASLGQISLPLLPEVERALPCSSCYFHFFKEDTTTAYPRHQLVGRQHPVDPLGVLAQDDGHLLGQLVHRLGGDLVLGQVGVQI